MSDVFLQELFYNDKVFHLIKTSKDLNLVRHKANNFLV